MWEIIAWKEIEITSTNSAVNYYENQFFQKDHQHLYLPKISLVIVNRSTDMQVYNESRQQSKNPLIYYSKTTVDFIFFFWLTRMKELE